MFPSTSINQCSLFRHCPPTSSIFIQFQDMSVGHSDQRVWFKSSSRLWFQNSEHSFRFSETAPIFEDTKSTISLFIPQLMTILKLTRYKPLQKPIPLPHRSRQKLLSGFISCVVRCFQGDGIRSLIRTNNSIQAYVTYLDPETIPKQREGDLAKIVLCLVGSEISR